MSAEMSVLSANAAFYDAFQSCDVAKMKAVWSDSDDVTCVHPGHPLLSGADRVLNSWRALFASAGGMPPSVDVVSAHLQAIQDQWYQHDNPLLTAEREAHLREAWSTAAMRQQDRPPRGVLPADHLPLAVAFEVLFTPEERGEIGIDGFVSDLLDGDPTHGEGRGEPSGVPDAPRSIGLEEALAYLRREQ